MSPVPLPTSYDEEEAFLDRLWHMSPAERREVASDLALTDGLASTMSKWMREWFFRGHIEAGAVVSFFEALVQNPSLSTWASVAAATDVVDFLAAGLPGAEDAQASRRARQYGGQGHATVGLARYAPGPLLEAWATNPALPLAELTGELKETFTLPSLFEAARLHAQALLPSHSHSLRLAQPATPSQGRKLWPELRRFLRTAQRAGSDVGYERGQVDGLAHSTRSPAELQPTWNDLDKLLRADFHRLYDRNGKVRFQASHLLWAAVMAKLFAPEAFEARLHAPTFWTFVRTRSLYEAPAWFWLPPKAPRGKRR